MQSAWFIASILRCAPRQVVIAEPLAALETFLRERADTEEPRILAQLLQVLTSRSAEFANQDLLSLRGEALDLGAALIEAWIQNRYGSDEWARCGVYKAANAID